MNPIPGTIFLLTLAACACAADPGGVNHPGSLPDGGYLLPNGWRIRPAWASNVLPSKPHLLTHDWDVPPAGVNIPVSTLPMSQALLPGGRILAVLNAGYSPPTISLIDLMTAQETSRTPMANAWRGLAFSASGDRLYAGDGNKPSVTEFAVDRNSLRPLRLIPLSVSPQAPHLIADILLTNDGLIAADMAGASITVADLPSGKIRGMFRTAPQPYALLLAPDGKSVFASSWSTAKVVQYRLSDGAEMATIAVGAHPTEMVWLPGARLAIACANTNRVYVVGRAGGRWQVAEKIDLALTPRQPVGTTPSALSLASGRLYVACSDLNAIAVVDVSQSRSEVLGFIPTGWYPTSVRALPDGRLVAVNARGLHSFSNSNGLNPWRWGANRSWLENHSTMEKGSVLLIADPDPAQLQKYTETVRGNSPYGDYMLDAADVPPGSPIPSRVGDPSPIRHVIFVVEGMRTYDQILGDMPEGDGDRSKVMFGEENTPNYHKLAREFALLDNFYAPGDAKDGFYWTMAGITPDSTVRMGPIESSHRLPQPNRYEEGPEGERASPDGFLWDRAVSNRVSFFNYGTQVVNRPEPSPLDPVQIADVRDPILKPHTSREFSRAGIGNHTTFDIDRIRKIFVRDLHGWEKEGEMPRLVLVSLGKSHTDGAKPGNLTPFACMSDSDQALGLMVEAVSKSRFWSQTAIFFQFDDPEDGTDHVDSHRTVAYVISPYSKRGAVDHAFYNSLSMLRTIELILGFQPMTVFDAGAAPMASVFQSSPDLRPYLHAPARVSITERIPPRAQN